MAGEEDPRVITLRRAWLTVFRIMGDRDPDVQWLCDQILRADDAGLETLLGIETPPGHRRAASLLARARRDAAICSAARRLAPDAPAAHQAAELHVQLVRYAASAWREDREIGHPRAVGNLMFYMLMQDCGGRVLSVHSLRKIIGAGNKQGGV